MRIGIFGGTFDPPHRGHLALAKASRKQLCLDRLLWMLTPDPPHKLGQSISPIHHRYAMVHLALSRTAWGELSRIEMDRPGPHYAVDTVNLVRLQYPGAELIFLMGGDSLDQLPTWHHPLELISSLDYLGVMRRPSSEFDLDNLEQLLPGLTNKLLFVNAPQVDVSGSEIRQGAAAGKSFRKFVLPPVYRYIVKHKLYLES